MKLPVLSWILCVLALIGLLAWLGSDVVPLTKDKAGREQGKALIGGDFTLVDGAGKTVTEQDFRGKYMLVYFGFTHCPDICPTSLLLIQNALNKLNGKGKKVVPVFITLDPERDTPEAVGQYVAHFGPTMVGLSGTRAQIDAVAAAYKVYHRKAEVEDSAMGYVIDHSGFMYLMGPDGAYITPFPHTISEQSLTDGLAAAIK